MHNGSTLTDPSGKSYTWDFENRLTQVVVPGTGTVTFKYDPFGRRIQKSSPSGTVNYLYDGANAVEEVDPSGNVLARYIQGGIDEAFAELRSGTSSYYDLDGLGSTSSLSNSAGALANTYVIALLAVEKQHLIISLLASGIVVVLVAAWFGIFDSVNRSFTEANISSTA